MASSASCLTFSRGKDVMILMIPTSLHGSVLSSCASGSGARLWEEEAGELETGAVIGIGGGWRRWTLGDAGRAGKWGWGEMGSMGKG